MAEKKEKKEVCMNSKELNNLLYGKNPCKFLMKLRHGFDPLHLMILKIDYAEEYLNLSIKELMVSMKLFKKLYCSIMSVTSKFFEDKKPTYFYLHGTKIVPSNYIGEKVKDAIGKENPTTPTPGVESLHSISDEHFTNLKEYKEIKDLLSIIDTLLHIKGLYQLSQLNKKTQRGILNFTTQTCFLLSQCFQELPLLHRVN